MVKITIVKSHMRRTKRKITKVRTHKRVYFGRKVGNRKIIESVPTNYTAREMRASHNGSFPSFKIIYAKNKRDARKQI